MKQLPFSMSAPYLYRIYWQNPAYNLTRAIVLGGGIGALILLLFATQQILSEVAYLCAGGWFLAWGLLMVLSHFVYDRLHRRSERRTVHNIIQGKDLLVAWQYTADEWHTLAELQTAGERHLGDKWWRHLIPVAIAGSVWGYAIFAAPPNLRSIALLIGLFMIVMSLVMVVSQRYLWHIVSERNHQRRMEKLTPTLYISLIGTYHETEGLIRFGHLRDVALESVDDFPKLVFSGWLYTTRRGRLTSVSIPIPRRYLPDAHKLVAQLK